MIVITSFSQSLYDKYAHRVVETFHNWPVEAKLIVYSEDIPPSGKDPDRVQFRDLNFPDLVRFKAACEPTEDYRYDAARFSNKVWAMVEGSMNESGLCFWLDADCVTYRKMPADFLRRLIPPQYYIGYFGRQRMYTETGFWGVRANNEYHRDFMTCLKSVYLSGTIFKLPQWHDCYALDYTMSVFDGKVKRINLSEDPQQTHPIARSPLGRYIDHCKGARKANGYSPENRWHKELHDSGRSPVLGND